MVEGEECRVDQDIRRSNLASGEGGWSKDMKACPSREVTQAEEEDGGLRFRAGLRRASLRHQLGPFCGWRAHESSKSCPSDEGFGG